jgi:hypothetical protein
MITIAGVTMFFLPGTFVSAILSTTFFDYEATTGIRVSGKVWILFAATVPLTIAVFLVWLGWVYVRRQKQQTGKVVLPAWFRKEKSKV